MYAQRRAVREAHARLRLYDVGWRRNAAQVFGTTGPKRRWRAWVARLSWGGHWCVPPSFVICPERLLMLGSSGTGTQFPRNPHAEEVLDKLAAELVRLECDNDAD